jgi:ferredoxin
MAWISTRRSVRPQPGPRCTSVEAGTPILTALLDAGVDVPYACGAGICGACAVRVVEGRIDHRDSVLSRSERDAGNLIITCVSRAADDGIVLDL